MTAAIFLTSLGFAPLFDYRRDGQHLIHRIAHGAGFCPVLRGYVFFAHAQETPYRVLRLFVFVEVVGVREEISLELERPCVRRSCGYKRIVAVVVALGGLHQIVKRAHAVCLELFEYLRQSHALGYRDAHGFALTRAAIGSPAPEHCLRPPRVDFSSRHFVRSCRRRLK